MLQLFVTKLVSLCYSCIAAARCISWGSNFGRWVPIKRTHARRNALCNLTWQGNQCKYKSSINDFHVCLSGSIQTASSDQIFLNSCCESLSGVDKKAERKTTECNMCTTGSNSKLTYPDRYNLMWLNIILLMTNISSETTFRGADLFPELM